MYVQRFDDSLNSAIHTTYRISLRSSSMPEPRDPLLKVLTCFSRYNQKRTVRFANEELGGQAFEATEILTEALVDARRDRRTLMGVQEP